MKRFQAVFRCESGYKPFLLSLVLFALSYGLYKGVIDNYLAEKGSQGLKQDRFCAAKTAEEWRETGVYM